MNYTLGPTSSWWQSFYQDFINHMAFKKLLTLMYSNLVDHPLAMLVRQTCERKKK